MKFRLFTKLLIAFVTAGLLVAAASEYLIERQLKKNLLRWIEDEMTAEATLISLMSMEEIAGQAVELAERSRSRLTLIDATGRVVTDTDLRDVELDNHLNRPEVQEARLKGKGASVRYSHSLKMDMLYVAVPLGDQKQPKGYIRLSRSLQEVIRAIHPLMQIVMLNLYGIVVVSLLIALLFFHRLISPIRKLAAFTEKARTGHIFGQIRIESRDEIGSLAENINGMVEVLHEKIRNADEERRKLQAVFAGMVEGIVVLDAHRRVETHQPRDGGDDRFPVR